MKNFSEITKLLNEWKDGDSKALDKLIQLVMTELKKTARRKLRLENKNHTFQTTELVNELFLKLVNSNYLQIQNRSHFFAICSKIIRQILIDYARNKSRQKRGGCVEHISIDEVQIISQDKTIELIALDKALGRLAKLDQRKSQIIELRYFGGLTVNEVSEVLDIPVRTVERDWQMAKAWLAKEIS